MTRFVQVFRVTHPHLVAEALEKRVDSAITEFVDCDISRSVLSVITLGHLAAKIPGDFLTIKNTRNVKKEAIRS